MSEMVRNKGILIPTNMDTEHFTEDDWDYVQEEGFEVIDGEVYEVKWEVKGDSGCAGFTEVEIDTDCGYIHFHTYHYNGGGHWTEVVEAAVKKKYEY